MDSMNFKVLLYIDCVVGSKGARGYYGSTGNLHGHSMDLYINVL